MGQACFQNPSSKVTRHRAAAGRPLLSAFQAALRGGAALLGWVALVLCFVGCGGEARNEPAEIRSLTQPLSAASRIDVAITSIRYGSFGSLAEPPDTIAAIEYTPHVRYVLSPDAPEELEAPLMKCTQDQCPPDTDLSLLPSRLPPGDARFFPNHYFRSIPVEPGLNSTTFGVELGLGARAYLVNGGSIWLNTPVATVTYSYVFGDGVVIPTVSVYSPFSHAVSNRDGDRCLVVTDPELEGFGFCWRVELTPDRGAAFDCQGEIDAHDCWEDFTSGNSADVVSSFHIVCQLQTLNDAQGISASCHYPIGSSGLGNAGSALISAAGTDRIRDFAVGGLIPVAPADTLPPGQAGQFKSVLWMLTESGRVYEQIVHGHSLENPAGNPPNVSPYPEPLELGSPLAGVQLDTIHARRTGFDSAYVLYGHDRETQQMYRLDATSGWSTDTTLPAFEQVVVSGDGCWYGLQDGHDGIVRHCGADSTLSDAETPPLPRALQGNVYQGFVSHNHPFTGEAFTRHIYAVFDSPDEDSVIGISRFDPLTNTYDAWRKFDTHGVMDFDGPPPIPYQCPAGSICAADESACSAHVDCQSGFCSAGACSPRLPDGTQCEFGLNEQCISENCAEPNRVCTASSTPYVCPTTSPCLPDGADCAGIPQSDCASGRCSQVGAGFECVARAADGSFCTANGDCSSQSCLLTGPPTCEPHAPGRAPTTVVDGSLFRASALGGPLTSGELFFINGPVHVYDYVPKASLFDPVSLDLGAGDWTLVAGATPSALILDRSTSVSGRGSLLVDAAGRVELRSPWFDPARIDEQTGSLAIDVLLSGEQPSSGYRGALEASFFILGDPVAEYSLGRLELSGVPLGAWHTVGFALPQALRDVLATNVNDLELKLVVETDSTASAGLRLDRVLFSDGAPCDGPALVSCGVGTCLRRAPALCVDGELQGECVPGVPAPEQNDGLDNDCDGSTDEFEGTANAGSDQLVECTGSGKALVVLDGSASTGTSGVLSYAWSVPGVTLQNSNQALASGDFPLGTTTATLRVGGTEGATDSTLITVVDTMAPTLTIPGDVVASSCTSVVLGQATATDACAGTITPQNDAPATFSAGTYTVTWRAVDAFGNTTTRTQKVTVGLGDNSACCPPGTTVLAGTSNNDTLTGTSGADCILGKGGQDSLKGLGGNDFLSAGGGDDVVEGGDGNDFLDGGSGQDTLRGQNGNDAMLGNDGDDWCYGGNQDDLIRGGQGQDRSFGESGNDALYGDSGDDILDGGAGDDLLDGGGLHDQCSGGSGTNTLMLCNQ